MITSTPTTTNTAASDAIAEAVAGQLSGKKFYQSRTFWVNVIAASAMVVQARYGFIIGAEYQAVALSLVNLVLRKVTSEPIIW